MNNNEKSTPQLHHEVTNLESAIVINEDELKVGREEFMTLKERKQQLEASLDRLRGLGNVSLNEKSALQHELETVLADLAKLERQFTDASVNQANLADAVTEWKVDLNKRLN